jgi:hypothetical protein
MDAPALAVLLDIHLMLVGGMERNEGQWKALLESVGLEIVKVWRKGQKSVIEARLKG